MSMVLRSASQCLENRDFPKQITPSELTSYSSRRRISVRNKEFGQSKTRASTISAQAARTHTCKEVEKLGASLKGVGKQGGSRKGSSSASPVCRGYRPHDCIPYMSAALENNLLNGKVTALNRLQSMSGGIVLCNYQQLALWIVHTFLLSKWRVIDILV